MKRTSREEQKCWNESYVSIICHLGVHHNTCAMLLHLPCPREPHLTQGFWAPWLPSVMHRDSTGSAGAAGSLHALMAVWSISETNILGSLRLSKNSLSDLQCVTSNLCIDDSCLVLWINFSLKIILKKKELIDFKTWCESLSPAAVKSGVKLSAMTAYFILQIPLFAPMEVFMALFIFNYGFPDILRKITTFFFITPFTQYIIFSTVFNHKESIWRVCWHLG